jgi:hypothetical protein
MKKAATITLVATIPILIAIIRITNVSPSNEAWAASAELMKEEYYGFGYKLYPDEYTDTTKRFRTIIESPKSYLVFRKLYDDGGYVAKAYAIAGLHQSFIGRFDSRIEDFRRMNCSIPVVFHNPLSPEQVISELSADHFKTNIDRTFRDR